MADSTFSVRLPDALKSEVDSYAAMTHRSRSFIVKEAIAAYMKDRTAYLEQLNAAVASIDTDETYDFEGVSTWTKSWGTKDEKPLSDVKPSV